MLRVDMRPFASIALAWGPITKCKYTAWLYRLLILNREHMCTEKAVAHIHVYKENHLRTMETVMNIREWYA